MLEGSNVRMWGVASFCIMNPSFSYEFVLKIVIVSLNSSKRLMRSAFSETPQLRQSPLSNLMPSTKVNDEIKSLSVFALVMEWQRNISPFTSLMVCHTAFSSGPDLLFYYP